MQYQNVLPTVDLTILKYQVQSLAWMKEKCQTITCLDEKQETQIIDCIWESRPLEQNINN